MLGLSQARELAAGAVQAPRCHGEPGWALGSAPRSRGCRESVSSVSGGLDHVPGGAASVFPLSSTQVNAPCGVTQKRRRCNRNVPPLVGPAGIAGSGTPGHGTGGGEAIVPQSSASSAAGEGKGSFPREIWPGGLVPGGRESPDSAGHRGGKG